MFDQMKQLKQVMSLLGNPAELREKMETAQRELADVVGTGESGGGAVKASVDGRMKLVDLKIDPAMIGTIAGAGADADREMVEELVLSAVNAAVARAQEEARARLSEITGGMDLPLPSLGG
ncbi:MAG: YbaB/EbfC family nucleoid-associated protein [Planctomycetota bacterium]